MFPRHLFTKGPLGQEIHGKFQKKISNRSPLLLFWLLPPLFSLINHYSLLISRQESGLQLSKPPSLSPPFLPSFLFLGLASPRSRRLPAFTFFPSLPIVLRQLVEILSARNNFTTTVPTITVIVTATPPPLPSHIRLLFSVLKLQRCGNRRSWTIKEIHVSKRGLATRFLFCRRTLSREHASALVIKSIFIL